MFRTRKSTGKIIREHKNVSSPFQISLLHMDCLRHMPWAKKVKFRIFEVKISVKSDMSEFSHSAPGLRVSNDLPVELKPKNGLSIMSDFLAMILVMSDNNRLIAAASIRQCNTFLRQTHFSYNSGNNGLSQTT